MTIALAASLIEQGGLAEDGRAAAEKALDSGAAAERFAAMIAALGGPSDFVERPRPRHRARRARRRRPSARASSPP